jgi:DNA-binding response OmpR family regulator
MNETIVPLPLSDDAEVEHLWLDRLLRQIDGARYRLDWVSDDPAAVAAMETDDHDLYFVDYRLGRKNGLDLIGHARRRDVPSPSSC